MITYPAAYDLLKTRLAAARIQPPGLSQPMEIFDGPAVYRNGLFMRTAALTPDEEGKSRASLSLGFTLTAIAGGGRIVGWLAVAEALRQCAVALHGAIAGDWWTPMVAADAGVQYVQVLETTEPVNAQQKDDFYDATMGVAVITAADATAPQYRE